jgi:hypothetical protein
MLINIVFGVLTVFHISRTHTRKHFMLVYILLRYGHCFWIQTNPLKKDYQQSRPYEIRESILTTNSSIDKPTYLQAAYVRHRKIMIHLSCVTTR